MLTGVFAAQKKDGSTYYRSNITFQGKHISLGSFSCELDAHQAYLEADRLLKDQGITIVNILFSDYLLGHDKIVTLLNFRDHRIYMKNPIYMYRSYFHYYLTPEEIYKFDIDDLFYFSSHKLLKRGGRLYVNDYGMQVTVLSRYGIRNFAVAGKDYLFANQDPYDLRYENIININPFHGVRRLSKNGTVAYETYIHIRGDYRIGIYDTLYEAAIAYNKAADLARQHGVDKNFPTNFITELSAREYAQAYVEATVSEKYKKYLKRLQKR
ncbi:MAG: hypothetical protein K2N87_09980 [Eubacterium sp.]|nr:hypothetical protein [Eubacterium sp.]